MFETDNLGAEGIFGGLVEKKVKTFMGCIIYRKWNRECVDGVHKTLKQNYRGSITFIIFLRKITANNGVLKFFSLFYTDILV